MAKLTTSASENAQVLGFRLFVWFGVFYPEVEGTEADLRSPTTASNLLCS